MDQRASKALVLDHTLLKKNREYKMRWQNGEAKLGWTKAQHARKLHSLTHELDRYRRGKAFLQAEIQGWRGKFEGLNVEHVALKEETSHLRGHLTRYIDENKQLKEQTIQTRDSTADESTDELLVLLHERWKSSQATINKHQKKVQSMQDALESERQRNTELLQGLNDKDMADPRPPKAAEDQLTRLSNISSKLSTVQQWLDERLDDESKSCGHSDAGAVGLTACNVLLCEACREDMLSCRMLVNWHVCKCLYCLRQCVLLLLLKQVTKPTKQETIEMQDIMELVQQDLSELIGASSAVL
ncbi:hypothetical protein H2198_002982 [Neophaeococcomyces mojaviensis]|uniref:Uncharacterized protein n=1 Tax=Neophaeococcomyces mojaviensis TaxID=3383035 RepID=A0ACC3ACR1_9EURO|nr:hypothetical protein H2198_002982 [Knufia sp. JES_112]